ncbi:HDOD domain-containing protein, partial [Arthrospira platensis SPKY1]|nr:HDOD domain-containing protein [Arthrospira platensis SPKY1]
MPATGYGWAPGDCVRHTLGVACAARALAKIHGKVGDGSAYTAALVHDFGKLAMSVALGEKLLKVFHHQNQEKCFWTEAETQVFGFNHCDVSRVLMEQWQFPVNLIQTAVY